MKHPEHGLWMLPKNILVTACLEMIYEVRNENSHNFRGRKL